MQMRNNYDIKLYDRSGKQVGEGVFNGDIGTIRKINGTNIVIEFDGRYMIARRYFWMIWSCPMPLRSTNPWAQSMIRSLFRCWLPIMCS